MSSQPVGQARRSKRPPVIPDDVADPAVVKATGLMTLPTRVRLRVDVETIVQDVNRFLRGWAGYFRYGNSARMFDKIRTYAVQRLALLVAKRHKQRRAYGFKVVAYLSPDTMGLVSLNGWVVAPRPNRPWREKPNATR